eukprot:Hpha_TRINITY_DN31329_c0_g1::TRINITY_DN31329_c0_g1_i1::g.194473::m.194473
MAAAGRTAHDLPLIEVPHEYASFGLDQAALHWIGPVLQYDENWVARPCACILSDECLYICTADSKVLHCVPAAALLELVVNNSYPDGAALIGIRVEQDPAYDLLLTVREGPQRRDELAHMLAVLHETQGQGDPLRVTPVPINVGTPVGEVLCLTRPTGWRCLIEPIRSKRAAGEQRARAAAIRQRCAELGAGSAVAEAVTSLAERLREELQHDFHQYRDTVADEAGTAGEWGTVGALQLVLKQEQEELLRCRQAVQNARVSQQTDTEGVRGQLLQYDREVSSYLRKVLHQYPSALSCLGAPPELPQSLRSEVLDLRVPEYYNHGRDPQRLAEENAVLRQQVWNLENSSVAPSYQRPAAESRRQVVAGIAPSGAVSGGLGPGGAGAR